MHSKLLYLPLALIFFASCQKERLKGTTVAFDYELTTVEMAVNEDGRYLNGLEGDSLLLTYVREAGHLLDKTKMEVVSLDQNPDWVVTMKNARFQERPSGDGDYDLKAIGLSVNYQLTAVEEDKPQYFNVWLETRDCYVSDSCDSRIEYTSLEELSAAHAKELRGDLKRKIRRG